MRATASSRLLRSLGLLAAFALLLLSGTAEAGQRTCVTATIQERFVLPDGSEHAAGTLRLCKLKRHYPSSTLLVSYVDGRNVCMLLGTSGHNESDPGADPFMIFARDSDGTLRLYGYGLPEGSGVSTFTLHRPDRLKAVPRLPAAAS